MATRKAVVTIIAEFNVIIGEEDTEYDSVTRKDVEYAAKDAAETLRGIGEVTFGELVFLPAEIKLQMEAVDLT